MNETCRLCGSSDAISRYKVKAYTIKECCGCGFVYTSPLAAQESIYNLYKNKYFSSKGSLGYTDYEENSRIRVATFRYYFSKLEPFLSRKENVLDVGCADGSFLRITKDEVFNCNEGIELNEEMFERTSKEFHLYKQPLEQFVADKEYDLITLFDVLEHIPDLKNACAKLGDICRTDGLLVVLTPDYGSRSRKLYGSKWFQFKPEEHINYFTEKRMTELLAAYGFETLYTEKGVSRVDQAFIRDRLKRYGYRFPGFLFSLFGKLIFGGKPYIKINNSSIFLIARRVR
jgi:SAM-dependent methyltransferase